MDCICQLSRPWWFNHTYLRTRHGQAPVDLGSLAGVLRPHAIATARSDFHKPQAARGAVAGGGRDLITPGYAPACGALTAGQAYCGACARGTCQCVRHIPCTGSMHIIHARIYVCPRARPMAIMTVMAVAGSHGHAGRLPVGWLAAAGWLLVSAGCASVVGMARLTAHATALIGHATYLHLPLIMRSHAGLLIRH